MSFLDHIAACNSHDIAKFRPLVADDAALGWVRHDVAGWLAAFPDVYTVDDRSVRLLPATPDRRSAAIDATCAELHARHGTPTPKGERYAAVRRWGDEAAFTVDRAVVSLFGLRAHGVHVNGFVRAPDGLKLWIGKRAEDKSVAPGKLDNMVAGGQPAHLSLMDNVVKEAAEEADVPAALARQARPVGAVSYCLEDQWGLKPDVMFCFDLELPTDFTPRNTDGEIQGFRLMTVDAVAALVRDGDAFKYNVPLVIIDFLIRHGRLDPDGEPDYLAIVRGLRRGR